MGEVDSVVDEVDSLGSGLPAEAGSPSSFGLTVTNVWIEESRFVRVSSMRFASAASSKPMRITSVRSQPSLRLIRSESVQYFSND